MSSLSYLVLHGVIGSLALFIMKLSLAEAKAHIMSGHFLDKAVLVASCGIALYIASFLLWLFVLTRTPLSYAYPISIGVTLLITSFLSIFMLSEAVSLTKAIGMLSILIGVMIIHWEV